MKTTHTTNPHAGRRVVRFKTPHVGSSRDLLITAMALAAVACAIVQFLFP